MTLVSETLSVVYEIVLNLLLFLLLALLAIILSIIVYSRYSKKKKEELETKPEIEERAVCRKFCKITNFKQSLTQKFDIIKPVSCAVYKNFILNLQQIWYTAKESELRRENKLKKEKELEIIEKEMVEEMKR